MDNDTSLPESTAAAAASSPMQELLSRRCRALHQALEPLLEPTQALVPVLNRSLPADSRLAGLKDATADLQQLLGKLAEQEAFVLVFGPLKSGKSTLMNAICGSYVSEVTALPAYPCMVHVRHGEVPSYRLQRHDGETETLTDGARVGELISRDHRALADAIRSAEADGEDFDPGRHAKTAIRRIDVEVPAGDLEQSGTVLVDTPGLYTRMKFGYDEMTREYRDVAACAVFVVKADNLFLDHVFAEFDRLLQLFDRIFLVVNLDSSKQDLQVDGSLRPSLEHEDPDAVVEAFESLAMSASLRDARAAGRLGIYPVDLLRAAAARIQGAEPVPEDFQRLLSDFTAYLNSNEHLRAFWKDCLGRGEAVVSQLQDVLAPESVQELEDRCTDLATERDQLKQASQSLQRLIDVDWQTLLGEQVATIHGSLAEPLAEARENVADACRKEVLEWFETEASLQQLAHERLQPILADTREEIVRLLGEEFQRVLGSSAFEAGMDSDLQLDLLHAQIGLEPSLQSLLDELQVDGELPEPELVFDLRALPVRRELLDWLLFRRAITVRRRLLGSEQHPDLAIAADAKARRLGEPAQLELVRQAQRALDPVFGQAVGPAVDRLHEALAGGFAAQLVETIEARSETVVAALDTRESELEGLQELLVSLRHASDLLDAQQAAVHVLAQQFDTPEADEASV